MKTMNVIVASAILAVTGCAAPQSTAVTTTPAAAGAEEEVGSLTLHNASAYEIYSIQLSPYEEPSWGENLLGDDPLLPGEGGTIAAISCSKYDLRMVDDEGAECVVQDIDLCFQDHSWEITDTVLAVCGTIWAP